jgi:ketosteroid isomerase-like protein
MEECPKNEKGKLFHVTALFEQAGNKPIAWHIAQTITAKEQTKAMAGGVELRTFEAGIDKGAEDPAKLFATTIGDGKALSATVSDRKDVVLYGSDPAERFVGGAKVKAQLAKWNLVLEPTSGIQAGVAKSGTIAWVAANVNAMPKKGSKAKPVPYRALFIYERTGTAWKLVNAHFSFLTM